MKLVARAVYDSVIDLGEDLQLSTPAAELHPIFGESLPEASFADLLSAEDQRRFRAAANLASVSQQPRLLRDVQIASKTVELMVAECCPGSGYLVGIKVNRKSISDLVRPHHSNASRHSGGVEREDSAYFSKWDSDKTCHSAISSASVALSYLQSCDAANYIHAAHGSDTINGVSTASMGCSATPGGGPLVCATLSNDSKGALRVQSSSAVATAGSSAPPIAHTCSGGLPIMNTASGATLFGKSISNGGLNGFVTCCPAVDRVERTSAVAGGGAGHVRMTRSGGGAPLRRSNSMRRTRSSRSNEMEDVIHCMEEQDGADGAEFVVTPFASCYKSVIMTLKHWHVPKGNMKCCPWHAVVEMMGQVGDKIATSDCDMSWENFSSWQCGRCKCVNPSSRECDVCGAILTSRRSASVG